MRINFVKMNVWTSSSFSRMIGFSSVHYNTYMYAHIGTHETRLEPMIMLCYLKKANTVVYVVFSFVLMSCQPDDEIICGKGLHWEK